MHFGLLMIAGLPLAVSNTSEIAQRSGRIRAAHEENLRRLIENDGEYPRFALPDSTANSKGEELKCKDLFIFISYAVLHAFKHKFLEKSTTTSSNPLTTAIVNQSKREADVRSYGVPTDKLTSASSALPSWPEDKEQSSGSSSWVEQFPSSFAASALQQLTPLQQQQQQQLLQQQLLQQQLQQQLLQQQLASIPQSLEVSAPGSAYAQSTPTAQELNFRQYPATAAYPLLPYIQPTVPAAAFASQALQLQPTEELCAVAVVLCAEYVQQLTPFCIFFFTTTFSVY
ncbi:uncharacterized protein EMH_0051280 [Eimeria mitis]|uniref:Uncharacterized protein n=1 Tax=Eimeria mitis TaxID=44415 RepID=U6JZX7_9EIME|nr:uncharacterized protein EMH_0051280 [Eimeria mitis]CDJ29617.1 hypothetical protein EMH_0051280 [Eimeria mitis]